MTCFMRLCRRFCQQFIIFHFKNWHNAGKDLILFRVLSMVTLLAYSIIDTIMYSSVTNEKSDVLKFLHASRHIGLEIIMVIYLSGAVTFGISIEIYIFVPYVIVNCVLVAQNCGGASETITGIIWIVKIVCLFLGIELCYRNFRKLPEYQKAFSSAARVISGQVLWFSVTILFLSSPGLRALYDAINKNLPNQCVYATRQCGIIDLYQPTFSYNNDKCLEDLTAYVSGREQLRVLRDSAILNGVSYSIFNENFVEIHNAKHVLLRILVVILYATLATSVLVSYVDPFFFINKCRLAYTTIECIIFVVLLGLLAYNLYDLHHQRQPTNSQLRQHAEPMNRFPRVLSTT